MESRTNACEQCGEPVGPDAPFRTFVWIGYLSGQDVPDKPDLRVHERCLPAWRPPDPYYHDTREPFPDSGM